MAYQISLWRNLQWNCAFAQFCKVLILSKGILHCSSGKYGNLAFIQYIPQLVRCEIRDLSELEGESSGESAMAVSVTPSSRETPSLAETESTAGPTEKRLEYRIGVEI